MWEIFEKIKYNKGRDEHLLEKKKEIEIEIVEEKETIEYCKSCADVELFIEDGFPICLSCGTVYKYVLDYSPEWKFYNSGDKLTSDPTRCGNPINPLLKESSFGCKILCDNNSSYEMRRIQKWTEWQSIPHKEKTLYEEFQFISLMAQNAGIPKILIDYAMMVHKELSEQIMFRGMNRDGIKAASLYLACKHNGYQRSSHEIATIFQIDKHNATNGCSKGLSIWNNIERKLKPSFKTQMIIITPRIFVDRYCSRLNIPNELILLIKFIADKIQNINIITENTPQSSAAGIIYFVAYSCRLNITKNNIKVLCDVSEVTINKCYQKINLIRHSILPPCIIHKYNIQI
jgi:transcription initiation factor TFIIB